MIAAVEATVLDAAFGYARVKLATFPVEPRGKAPIGALVPNGKDDATTDLATLTKWFKGADSNIGIAMKPSDLVTVDIDLPKAKNGNTDGRQELAALVADLGELPPTWTADTGSGGVHYVFRAPPAGEYAGKLGKAIDFIRNGYIVAAPSVHASGNSYAWRPGLAPGDVELADLPAAWIERARRPAPRTQAAAPRSAVGEDFYAALESLDQRVVLEDISGTSLVNGERFAFKATRGGKHNLFADQGGGFEGTRTFVDANGRIGAPDSGKKDGGPLASHWLRWYGRNDAEIRAGLCEHVPALARFAKRDPSTHDRNGAPVEPPAEPKAIPPRWRIETATAAWIDEKLPPREHLLVDTRTGNGAMDKQGVWLIGGAGGAGKSYATISLALAVVSNRAWLGTFKPPAAGRVLIVAAEDSKDDMRRRVHAIAAADRIPSSAMPQLHTLCLHDQVVSLVKKSDDTFAPSDDTISLCAEIASRDPYDLVIVDPYGRIAGVSLDADNAAAAATISALNMISAAARGLVLGVAHTSLRARLGARNGAPEGATGIRGATGQTDYARGVLRLEKDDSAIWLSLAKANHVAQWEPVGLQRGDRGELTALDAIDLAKLRVAGSKDTKAAKKQAERGEQDDLDDAAALAAIAAFPDLKVRDLCAIVRKERTCGGERAHAAVSRARNGART